MISRKMAFGLLLLAWTGSVRATTYSITDLGTLGGSRSDAYGLNASGQVVGSAGTNANTSLDPVLFSGYMRTDLGTFGGGINQANAINDANVIVGTNSQPGNLTTLAFVAFGNALVNLDTLGGTSSTATGINNAGQITGSSQLNGNTYTHAYLYQTGVMTDLGTLDNVSGSSFANGINATGHVVGESVTTVDRAFLYNGTTMVNLGGLGTGDISIAHAINDNDQIVGESNLVAGGSAVRPFLYQGGYLTDLGSLGIGTTARAYAINNSSQIVGESNLLPNSTSYHAFLYQGSQMTDLNDLIPQGSGWVLETARAINASGQIAGTGTIGGQSHAFLLSPNILSNSSSGDRPHIYINGAGRVVTTKPKVRVEGSVGGPVIGVKYRVGKGAYRSANGGTNGWRFTARLRKGRNVILVIATSANGLASYPAKMIVLRTHP